MTESDSTTAAPAIGLGSAARDLYRALWRHAEGVRSHMLGAAGLLSAAQLLRLTMPWLAAQATNALQQDLVSIIHSRANFGVMARRKTGPNCARWPH